MTSGGVLKRGVARKSGGDFHPVSLCQLQRANLTRAKEQAPAEGVPRPVSNHLFVANVGAVSYKKLYFRKY